MSRCYGRYIGLEGTDCFVCDVCGAWCEGPCAGLTDDEVRQWENDRGEPAAAARPGDEEEDGGGNLPDEDDEDGDLLRCSGVSVAKTAHQVKCCPEPATARGLKGRRTAQDQTNGPQGCPDRSGPG